MILGRIVREKIVVKKEEERTGGSVD